RRHWRVIFGRTPPADLSKDLLGRTPRYARETCSFSRSAGETAGSGSDDGLPVFEDDRCDRPGLYRALRIGSGPTPDDGVAERLAYLGARSSAEHERHGPKHRRHRRHENRPEAFDASLIDRLLRREALFSLGVKGEVDKHNAVLLDDADQQEDADDGNHAQIEAKRHQ